MHQVSPFVSNLLIILGLTIVSLIQFNLLLHGMITVFAVCLDLALVFGKNFQILAAAVLAALICGAWLDHFINPSTRLVELAPVQAASENGPVIHLLMDGFIGPDGLPRDQESQAVRSQVVSFFSDYDFHLYTRAYSHYTTTADSMTRMLNFRNDDENIFQTSALLGEAVSYDENAWFTALDESGYQLVVYQTESMDFCQPPLTREIKCNVYPMPNLRTLHRDLDNRLDRAAVLLRTLASQSKIISNTFNKGRILDLGFWGVSVYDERIMDHLSRDIQLQPGNAYFAHVLMPHAPAIYREDCSIDYDAESWTRWPHSGGAVSNTEESRAIRQSKLLPQIKCALKLLGELFDDLKASDLYDKATIIVHGDHGTSAFLVKPSAYTMNQLNYRDLQEAYSTLFAVKLPGGTFSVNEEISSLNVLMARTAGEVTGKSAEELGASVTSEEEPFLYLIDVFPLRRIYVNMFDEPADKDTSEETRAAD